MLPQNCFYLDSTMPAPSAHALYGYAICDDAVVFGTTGLSSFLAAHPGREFDAEEGRFSVVLREGGTIRIRTDVTGQDLIYYYRDDTFWAVSNAFALLVANVAQHRRLSLYEPAAIGFHLKDGVHIGEQLLCHKTLVENVFVLPATAAFEADVATTASRVIERPFCTVFGTTGLDYEACLTRFVERTAGLLGAVCAAAPSLIAQLSGGYDSRVVLALLLAGGRAPTGSFSIESFVGREPDFGIAESICNTLNLPLNVHCAGRRCITADEALRFYEMSCLATYLPIYPVPSGFTPSGSPLRLSGDLATDWKFFHGNARFNGTAEKIAGDIEAALAGRPHAGVVRDDFLSMFEWAGIDSASPNAMEIYYSLIRTRFHCGRHWYKELGSRRLISPLTSPDLVRLEILAGERGWDRRKIFCDILLATSPYLALHPFDKAEKTFPDSLLVASPFRGGATIVPRTFTVYGEISPAPEDPAKVFAARRARPYSHAALLTEIRARFDGIDPARTARIFTQDDWSLAREQISSAANLSHGMRKATHIYATSSVADMIAT